MADQNPADEQKQSTGQEGVRGGAGAAATPADGETKGNVAGRGKLSGAEMAAAEPEFMKHKPGNPPGIASQLREEVFGRQV